MDSLASKRFYKLAGDGLNLAMHNNQPSAAISIFNIKNDNLVLTNTFRQGSKIVDMFPFSTSSNNNCLATLSNQNEIFLWDLRYTNSCVNSIKCDDMVRSTRLAINSNGTKMAVGGHTGYVALYNFEELYFANIMAVSKQSLLDESAAGPTNNLIKPVKEFSNLTTCINSLNFVNIKGTDLLTFSSNGNWLDSDQMATTNFIKRKSSVENSTENNTSGLIKIANTNSKQIYSTFPSFKQKSEIGCLQDFKFSPGGKFLVCQNSKGKLPVFTLGHGLKY